MQKIVLFLLTYTILVFSISAKPSKKKKNSPGNPFELSEIVVKPENLITSYQSAETRYFDLLNTKLDITPIALEKKILGKAELLIKPYFYPQNTLTLDAKGMIIHSVELKRSQGNIPLTYAYDSMHLKISLDKTYTRDDQFSILIDYIAQPYLLDSMQSAMGRGIYFIDSEDKNPYKPYHMWSQGEEEASSTWFPTIDATNERCSQEIFITVDSAFLTLSNGLLLDSKDNKNGTRTDHWKQDKPHAPYLFFVGLGPYKKYTTSWKDKEVSYYTFPKYYDAVSDVFRNSVEQMQFFSDKLGIDYPWDKLSHMVAWDYTAGAMENTSAILYYDKLFCQKQGLIDDNFDYIIGHEIFHQWFGDYVTNESWSNLTLNESMADYSETLWMEYKYGKGEGDAFNYNAMNKYINYSIINDEPIVNYYYAAAHDLFDQIRYEKGGRVLHMLRNYVGDEAFFAALHKYLTDHKYSNVELADLRQAFESITGEDLNWFFNQWWLGKGHPILEIRHTYDEKNKTIELHLKQTQPKDMPVFRIPLKVDIFTEGKKQTEVIDITDREMAFYFPSKTKPQLVNFDADKILLCEKIDYQSTEENIFKFYNSPLYVDKREAIASISDNVKDNSSAQEVIYKAMTDKNWYLRKYTIEQIDPADYPDKNKLMLALQQVLHADNNSLVRQKAFLLLCRMEPSHIAALSKSVIEKDSSFVCISSAFDKLYAVDKIEAFRLAEKFKSTENPQLMQSMARIFADSAADNLAFLQKAIWLNNYRTYLNNFKSIKTFLRKCNDALFADGVKFLADVNLYEETDLNVNGAAKVLYELESYFEEKVKDKKITPEEKESANIRISLLEKTNKKLRDSSVDFRFN